MFGLGRHLVKWQNRDSEMKKLVKCYNSRFGKDKRGKTNSSMGWSRRTIWTASWRVRKGSGKRAGWRWCVTERFLEE